jgi:hypothetical protein
MGMPQPNCVQAQGELSLPIALGCFDVRIVGTSGATVASAGPRGSRYDKAMGIRVDCINLPASFRLPYPSLNVSIHMVERRGREEDIAPIAGVKK